MSFYFDSTTEFEHQDWVGTERMRTAVNGQVAGTYTSLPFGDGQSTSGNDWISNHFTGMEEDYGSYTDHAQFRQYSQTNGAWLSPDPYSGSYDFTNPQSFNRYAYVMNSPVSFVDPSGLKICDGMGCIPGGGGGGDGCWDNDLSCDPGGCDPLDYYCDGPPPPDGGGGYSPNPMDFVDLDPNHIMTERLGLPRGMRLPTGDILDIFGIGSGVNCAPICEIESGAGQPIPNIITFHGYDFDLSKITNWLLGKVEGKVAEGTPARKVALPINQGITNCVHNFLKDEGRDLEGIVDKSQENSQAGRNSSECLQGVENSMPGYLYPWRW